MVMRRLFVPLVCVLGLGLNGCRLAAQLAPTVLPAAQRPASLPQDPQIPVYFNHNTAQGANYTDPYRQIERPGDDLEGVILQEIEQAQQSIEVAVQELRLPRIAQALAAKQAAGVRVRVVLENTYNQPWPESDRSGPGRSNTDAEIAALADQDGDGQVTAAELAQNDAILILRNARVPLIDDTADGSKGSGLMHHKFVVIDGATVVTGSANFTPSGTHGDLTMAVSRGNVNHLLVIRDRALSQLFQQEFNLLWGDGPGGRPDSRFGLQKPMRPAQTFTIGASRVTVHFSPTSPSEPWEMSSNGLIARTLSAANQSVDLALFVFSEQAIANTLATRHQQGTQVRVLIDPSFAFRDFSEGLDLLGVTLLKQNCQAEPNNQPWAAPITTVGVPALPPGDKLHHKFGVMDRRVVITGSHNWSAAANHDNDETVLIIDNPAIAAHFQQEFDHLFKGAQLGITSAVETKIQEAAQACGG
ncbi:phospholipase D-like domain-containing protein [Spirulina major CS-329]|uniref:phospholipase D-like domain-containing protein n=1 Tax=Spirulina TaxID=1154 RepID=UPI00232BA205|nr:MULTISPECIES: phospholipase D-like domain-containing protein [Spirulina]MDB9502853.1 phospholipase D-like domain-containing protein [Spirulina major CS-329]